jgi:hypothetical protein
MSKRKKPLPAVAAPPVVAPAPAPAAPPPPAEAATSDWITLTMACRIFPSRHAGKRLNKSTVWRWILKGTIEHTRNQLGWVFVRESQIRALVTPAAVEKQETKERLRARRQWDAHKAAVFARYGV